MSRVVGPSVDALKPHASWVMLTAISDKPPTASQLGNRSLNLVAPLAGGVVVLTCLPPSYTRIYEVYSKALEACHVQCSTKRLFGAKISIFFQLVLVQTIGR